MSTKRCSKHISVFSMASMTDVIFLLLIFFIMVSALVAPNVIKVNLSSSQFTATTQEPVARVTIDAEGYYYISTESVSKTTLLSVEELEAKLYEIGATHDEEEDPYIALYADKLALYGEIVKILNASTTAGLRMILATEALQDNSMETDV